MNTFSLAPLILVFPGIGILFNGLFGRRFLAANRKTGERWSGWLASAMVLAAFLVSLSLLASELSNDFRTVIVPLFTWINIPSADFYVPWAMQIDTLSVTMMLVVTGVGALIHIYAIGYMHGDPDYSRFFAEFNLFIFFMLILVSANNYLMTFVGWEGVGLCSYLLISFWWDRVDKDGKPMNANAGRKAFIVNRVGDFAVIIAMTMLFWTFGTLNYEPVFDQAVEFFVEGKVITFGSATLSIDAVITAVTILLLLGVAGKSAQIPLYIWLPDAMAGPTPVSALIHAATMVTAGVFLIVRSNVLYELARISDVQLFGTISSPELVAYTGAFTALVAALIAFTQWDIKKVLAYSTISQLGFMVAAAGMGAYVAAMFHLIMHAFFKALLFLGSGSVIHGMEHGHHVASAGNRVSGGNSVSNHDHADRQPVGDNAFDPQDMRTMGGLRHRMRITFVVYLIGALALAGIFPFAGFWSKDEVLVHSQEHILLIFVILVIAAFGTAFYVGRQLQLVFFGKPRHEAAEHAHESPWIMTVPLIILAILTTLGGLMNLPFITRGISEANRGHPEGIWLALEGWLEHSLESFEYAAEGIVALPKTPVVISPLVAGLSTLLAVSGLALAFFIYRKKPKTAEEPDPLQGTPIWWFSILPLNTLYMSVLVPLFNRFSYWLAFPVDWYFWHDFVHNRLIRDTYVSFANFLANIIDAEGVDGAVNGTGRLTRRLSQALGALQTGYVRTYALSVFFGAVALIIYFLLIAR
jgi:NADH-quinone oxidoreductase subunit L